MQKFWNYSELINSILDFQQLEQHDYCMHCIGYNESVDASIKNVFASAAMRFGHTFLPATIRRADSEYRVINGSQTPLSQVSSLRQCQLWIYIAQNIHVSRLCRLGGGQSFMGRQLLLVSVGVHAMGDATILRVGVQNNAASGASRIFFVCTPTCDILDTLVANEVDKNLSNKFVGGNKSVWRQLPHAPY